MAVCCGSCRARVKCAKYLFTFTPSGVCVATPTYWGGDESARAAARRISQRSARCTARETARGRGEAARHKQ